ncbi:hypothetical protein [Acidithiobacillus ferrivorans]|jgi:hypothetical protein|uniref:Uncharacterized protein n=1 Tax=Acidithiobacillus ferrivorans TaxID=160808 RepID=A0A7T4WDZ4_9PROT|nr:hypothetical protein [Acidithiobacillus ferrivorans]QQD72667.1 hypothetical protein H2515_15125 [Acidithiobacillus ferrivorans]
MKQAILRVPRIRHIQPMGIRLLPKSMEKMQARNMLTHSALGNSGHHFPGCYSIAEFGYIADAGVFNPYRPDLVGYSQGNEH